MHPVMHQQQRHRTCFIWLFNPDPFTFDQRQLYRCRIYGQIVDSWLICCRTEWRMRKKHAQCLFQLPVARNMLYQLIKRNLVLRFVLLPRRSFCFHSYKPVARSRSFFAFVLCLFLHNNVLFFVVLFFLLLCRPLLTRKMYFAFRCLSSIAFSWRGRPTRGRRATRWWVRWFWWEFSENCSQCKGKLNF